MPKTPFRVVVIDDNEDVCNRVSKRLVGPTSEGQPEVSVSIVHVRLEEKDSETWTFSKETFESLLNAASSPPDLVLVDYGFVDPNVSAQLREAGKHGELAPTDLDGKMLTVPELAEWTYEQGSEEQRTRLQKNLFRSAQPVYLYTYTPRGVQQAVGTPDERTRRVKGAFPGSRVETIDTKAELYNGDEFDWPSESKYDRIFWVCPTHPTLR